MAMITAPAPAPERNGHRPQASAPRTAEGQGLPAVQMELFNIAQPPLTRAQQLRERGNRTTTSGGEVVREVAGRIPVGQAIRSGRTVVRGAVDVSVGFAGEQTERTRATAASTTLLARAAVRGALAEPAEVLALNTRRRTNNAANKVVKHHEKVGKHSKDAETHRFAAEEARKNRKHSAAAFHEFMSGVSKKRAAKSSIRLSNAALTFDARRDTLDSRNQRTGDILTRAEALEQRAHNRRTAVGLEPAPSLREARETGVDTHAARRSRASEITDNMLRPRAEATPRVRATAPEVVPFALPQAPTNGNGRHAQ